MARKHIYSQLTSAEIWRDLQIHTSQASSTIKTTVSPDKGTAVLGSYCDN